jgi:hypothetical protein
MIARPSFTGVPAIYIFDVVYPPVSICGVKVVSINKPPRIVNRYYFLAVFFERLAVFARERRATGTDPDGFFTLLFSGGGMTFVSYGAMLSMPASLSACSWVSSTISPTSGVLPNAMKG